MFPFYFNKPPFGFPFPFPYNRRPKIKKLDNNGIPKIVTQSISETATTVTLGICPYAWCNLPCEGIILFESLHTPTDASAALPVTVSTSNSVSPAASNKNTPVVRADSSALTGAEIAAGNRYLIYYNKADGIMQVLNHYPTATAPAS